MILKLPPVIALFLLIISSVLNFNFPVRIIYFPYTLAGIIFIIAGALLMMYGFSLFKKRKTPFIPYQKPVALLTTGVFKVSRNPLYLGLILILLGIATLTGCLLFFFVPVAQFFILNFTFIPREEETLEKIFGKDYLNYKRKVRRWA